MFCRHWQWLIVAMCSSLGVACSHSRCNQCSTSVGTHVAAAPAKPTSTCNTCTNSAPVPVVAVKPCPCGTKRTFVIIPQVSCPKTAVAAAPCATCPKTAVAATPCTTRPKTTVAAVPCATCPKTAVAAAPCHTCPPAKTATAASPVPRVLDPKVAEAKPVEPLVPHGVAKVVDAAAPYRDPASGLIRYDHARDYAWVVGQLQYLHGKRQWRVRYSPCDVDDTFGGSVTITGLDHLADQFKDGSTVRIQGQLVDPNGHRSAPEYYVYDIKVLE